MSSSEVKDVVDDNITEVANAIVEAFDCGELQAAIDGGHDAWSKWIKGMGKGFKRKVITLPVSLRMHFLSGFDLGTSKCEWSSKGGARQRVVAYSHDEN